MFTSLLLLWIAVFFVILLLKSRRSKNFPPGPTVLPLVGNIFHVNLENPLKDFERVRKIYFLLILYVQRYNLTLYGANLGDELQIRNHYVYVC